MQSSTVCMTTNVPKVVKISPLCQRPETTGTRSDARRYRTLRIAYTPGAQGMHLLGAHIDLYLFDIHGWRINVGCDRKYACFCFRVVECLVELLLVSPIPFAAF